MLGKLFILVIVQVFMVKCGVYECVCALLTKYSCNKVLGVSDGGFRFENLSLANVDGESSSKLVDAAYDCFLISYDNSSEVLRTLDTIYYKPGFRSDSFTLLVLKGRNISEAFALLWKFFLVNVVVLSDDLGMYTYYPISDGVSIEPRYLGKCKLNLPKIRLQGAPMNFPNCTLRAVPNSIPPFINDERDKGLEVDLLNEVVRHLRFDLKKMGLDFFYFGPRNFDGSYAWELQSLLDHKLDLIIGAQAIGFNYEGHFETTYFHLATGNGIFVPMANRRAPWKNIVLIYHYWVWLGLSAMFVTTTTLYSWLSKEAQVLLMYSVLLSSAPYQPRRLELQIIFWTWAIVALIFTSVYQGLLTAYLFNPVYDKQITTLEEGVKRGLDFGGVPPLRIALQTSYKGNATVKHIFMNYVYCSKEAFECYDRVVFKKDFGLFRVDRLQTYYMQKNKSHRAYMLKPFQTIYFTMFLSRASPFYKRIDETVYSLIESGHVLYWDIYRNFPIFADKVEDHQPIRLVHLYIIFVAYICGLLASGTIFSLEILISS